MNLKQLQIFGINELKNAGVIDARIKVNILLAYLMKVNTSDLIKYDTEEINNEIKNVFLGNIEKIKKGYPIQYITGYQEFMKLKFNVEDNVLIPQPDTEILVEEVLRISNNMNEVRVLDLCTGSGCIGISLARYGKTIKKVFLSDISELALKVARKNIIENKVEEKVEVIQSNLFENINKKFDMIVSNPPYIKTDVIKELSLEVQNEPILALDGGKDGLYFYRKIIEEADKYLKPKGYLFLEIGYDQRMDINNILEELIKSGKTKFNKIECVKDLAGLDRVVILRSE